MSQNHLKIRSGVQFIGVGADPSDPANGDMIYRSDTHEFKYYGNGSWISPLYSTLTDTQVPFGNSTGGLSQSANLTWDTKLNIQSSTDASLGSELITDVNDRTFAADGNWSGTNWSRAGGGYVHVAGANAATLAGYAATIGGVYKVTVTVSTSTSGTLTITYGGATSNAVGQVVGALPAYTVVLKATTTGGLIITPNSSWAGMIDDVSIQLITTNASSFNLKNAAGVLGLEGKAVNGTSFGLGLNALISNTSGTYNTAVGLESMFANIYGLNNAAFGSQALKNNVSGSSNTAIGMESLLSNTSGGGNTATGRQALYGNTIGASNTANGTYALLANSTGSNNVAIGESALYESGTGNNNVAIGYNSLASNYEGNDNTAIGSYSSLMIFDASNCVSIGNYAGFYNDSVDGKLYIDAFNRGSSANDDAGAIITGTMSATVASQTLRFNALTSIYNDLRLMGATSGYVGLKGAAVAGSTTYTLPSADGSANQVLKTDGSGGLGWVTAGGSGDFTLSAISSSLNPAVFGTTYLVDTTAAISITLPAPSSGKWIRVKDYIGTGANTNNITIVRNGSEKIDNVAASFVMNSDRQSVLIVSDGTDWAIL